MILLLCSQTLPFACRGSPAQPREEGRCLGPLRLLCLCHRLPSPSSTIISEYVAGWESLEKEKAQMRREAELPEETQTCHRQRQLGGRDNLGSAWL